LQPRIENARRAALVCGAWIATAAILAAGSMPALAAKRVDRAPAVELTKEANGFTLTQDVRVSGDVRADYETATRLLQQQKYAEGIALLVKITESAPTAIAPFVDLGMAYSRTGDLDRAEASLQKALQIDPTHPIANNELGMVYRRKGRFAEARTAYEKALVAYPGFHYAHRNLAILCDLYLQDLDCALQHYEAYRQAVPDDQDAVKWIADLHNRTGR